MGATAVTNGTTAAGIAASGAVAATARSSTASAAARPGGGILIASASAGTGHVKAAEALRAALSAHHPDRTVEHVDVLAYAPGWVRSAYRGGFELLAARAPVVWRELYRRTDGPGVDEAPWREFAQRLLFSEFRRVVHSRRWDVCVCTHFLPAQLMAGSPGAPPFVMVITDFGLHRYWAQPEVEQYFVAAGEIEAEIRGRCRSARAETTGIPVRPDLLEAPHRAAARAQLGLRPADPAVVVAGGGLGIGITGLAMAAAASAVPGLQVIALCGHNEAARARLAEDGRVLAVPYVDDVRPYLAAADLIVTKPGGLSTSEALALGRPLLLASPIPGHEEANRSFLVEAGAALGADTPLEVAHCVQRILGDRAVRERLAANARRIGRPHAAEAIVSSLTQRYLLSAVA